MIAIEIPDLEIFLSAEKQQLIQTSSICLTSLQADIALGPKTKLLLHNMNYNFHLMSNIKTGIETIFLL
jgi:hypothetical protein